MKQTPASGLEHEIGHTFGNRELLDLALTHSSHAREHAFRQGTADANAASGEASQDNEQLEFLGDAVLGFVASQELFLRFPNYTEGELSKLRAHLVSARHLLQTAKELNLGSYLQLGRGEEKTGGRSKAALLVGALEAVLAALFLDAGLDAARALVLARVINPELERMASGSGSLAMADYKSELQERLHATGRPEPQYLLIAEEGPDHTKLFTMEARILDRTGCQEFAERGQGTTKKHAGQAAARHALERLNHERPNQAQPSQAGGEPEATE